MCRLLLLLLTLSVSLVISPQAAFAFDVVPTVSVIELPKNASGVTLVVRNPRNVALPITTEIVERFVEEDGKERHEPADDLFMVFPPQAVIPPGSSQSLRVQWLAEPPQQSRSFTLFASEIPVDLEGGNKSQLQTILRMGASVHVAAADSQAKPTLVAATPADKDVNVTLSNEGNRFFYIDTVTLAFDNKRITGLDLANMAGRTLVPPGARRTFRVTDVKGIPQLETR